jgi:hypothetical protein
MTLRDFFERYGVALGIVVLLAFVIAVLPGNANRQQASDITDTTGSTSDDGTTGNDGVIDDGPITSDGATSGGGGGGDGGTDVAPAKPAPPLPVNEAMQFGKGSCRSDKRQAGISVYMPPCLISVGSNGGATARGVTKDKIKVVRWIGQIDPGTAAILENAGLSDPESVKRADYEALRIYGNQHYYTHGREVEYVQLNASGPSENDEAMKADGVKIANDIKAFAVIEGTPDAGIPKVLARELAQRNVICICTGSLSSKFYQENPARIFSSLPTSTEHAQHIGEYIGKRLNGKKAQWAGDEFAPGQGYRNKVRKFGLLYIEGLYVPDQEGKRARDAIVANMKKYGAKFTREVSYVYEGGRNAQDVTNMVASLKGAGVTTVALVVDPLYPILITQEATRQGYFPEWFITGTGLSDTTTAGRLYDQLQWRHAFGISPLWITWKTVAKSGGLRARLHGKRVPQEDAGVLVNIYATYPGLLFTGIQLAGPVLTPDTFAKGMFSFPPTGGKPAAPLVYWTRDYPTAAKDMTEIWYDYDRSGPDERGENGRGMNMKVSGGKRYKPGQWQRTNPKAFVEDGTEIAVSDDPKLSGELPHEQDGHTHTGACLSCPGFKTNK